MPAVPVGPRRTGSPWNNAGQPEPDGRWQPGEPDPAVRPVSRPAHGQGDRQERGRTGWPGRGAGISATFDHGHLDPVAGRAPQRGLDQALVRLELPMDNSQVAPLHGPGRKAGPTSPSRATGLRATTIRPEVPLSRRWTMPGRSSSGPPLRCPGTAASTAAPACHDGSRHRGALRGPPACPLRPGCRGINMVACGPAPSTPSGALTAPHPGRGSRPRSGRMSTSSTGAGPQTVATPNAPGHPPAERRPPSPAGPPGRG